MINIENLRKYFESDDVLISAHASMRFYQRNIKIKDIKFAVKNGEIIEQYDDDFPFPSCLILGKTDDNKFLHIVMSDEGSVARVITSYFPDKNRWQDDYKTRKDLI